MNSNPQFQISSKRNGKLSQSLNQRYANAVENSDEEKVLKEIKKLVAAGQRRAIVIIAGAIASSSAMVFFLSTRPPIYQGKFQLLVEPVTAAENKLLSVVSQTLGITNPKTNESLDYESQIRVLKSPRLMMPIIDNIKNKYPDVDKNFAEEVKIERIMKEDEGTKILEISYSNKNPDRVQFVLDEISKAYLKYSREDRHSYLSQGLGFIENQIPQMQQQVDTLGKRLQALRQQYNLVDPAIQDRYLSEQANAIVKERVDIQMKLAQSRSVYTMLQQLYNEGNYAAVLSQDNEAYNKLIAQIHELDKEIEATSARFREESKTMRVLREQERELRERSQKEALNILQKAKSEVEALETRQQIVVDAENRLRQRVSQLPAITREANQLEAKLQVSNQTLNQLLAKRDQLRIEAAQQEIPWQLIAPPEIPRDQNGKPIKAKLSKKHLALIVVVGLVFGLMLGFVIEVINNVFHTPDEVEEETKLPVIGIIPFARKVRKPINKVGRFAFLTAAIKRVLPKKEKQGDSPVIEAFRSLYTNVRLLTPDTVIRSLVVGSATPAEGKTTVAVYLAQTAAAIGQRVLLVDADLRRPKVHVQLSLPNEQGLSDILTKDIGLNDAIARVSPEENLFVLTAGSIPKDPIKLLSSEKMRDLMEQFQSFFDLVIYDTPPLVGLADSNLLAAHSDGIVLVVGLQKTDRSMLIKALDGLSIAGASVFGVVANGIKGYKPKEYSTYYRR